MQRQGARSSQRHSALGPGASAAPPSEGMQGAQGVWVKQSRAFGGPRACNIQGMRLLEPVDTLLVLDPSTRVCSI